MTTAGGTAADGLVDAASGVPSVFLSYARDDRKRAMPVIAALEAAGFKVWWDGLLEGGQTFLPTTEAALEAADAVVVLWSQTAVDSHWVRDEATRGRDRGRMVPLSLDGCQPPLGFRQFQVIDLSKWHGRSDAPEIAAAIRAVAGFAGQRGAPLRAAMPVATSRRGVMIGGGLAVVAAAGGAVAWRAGLFAGKPELGNSIAVLPFKNLGGDPAQVYFSDGLSEELRATLARNRLLRIAAPTSSSELRDSADDVLEVSKKLKVGYVLRGSVRHDAERLRVAVELVNGKDASIVWTQSLDRKLSDVLALQSEVAAIVAKSLSAELSAQAIAAGRSGDWLEMGGTRNVRAFDAYLRGKALVDASTGEESDRAALAQLDAAVGLDPGYASALAARSKILAVIANETGKVAEIRSLYDRAVASAQAAIKAAPRLAEAHSALGYALYNGRLDPKAAREPYDRSRELGSGDADVLRTFAAYCAFTDRPADAAEAIATSLALDPLNPGVYRVAGYIAYARRDYAQSEAMMRKALELNPKLSAASSGLGAALYLSGRNPAALAAYRAEPLAIFRLQGLAIVERKAGNLAAAQQALDELVTSYGGSSAYQQAQVLAQWGDADGALARLDQAAAARDAGLLLARTDPMLDPLRKLPRFAELLSRLGLS